MWKEKEPVPITIPKMVPTIDAVVAVARCCGHYPRDLDICCDERRNIEYNVDLAMQAMGLDKCRDNIRLRERAVIRICAMDGADFKPTYN